MYVLNLFYENLRCAGTGSISFGEGRRWVRKWTVLPPGRKSHRLLQAIACACGGPRFVERLGRALAPLRVSGGSPVKLECTFVRCGPWDTGTPGMAVHGTGLSISTRNRIDSLPPPACSHLPEAVPVRPLACGTGVRECLFLGYGAIARPRASGERFDFGDPFHRCTRFRSLFVPAAGLTHPVDFLARLHYRGVLKGRVPAREMLKRFRDLFLRHLGLDVRAWLERDCCFEREWGRLRPHQRRALLPVLDAARHFVDASPHLLAPLGRPGLIVLHRPDAVCSEGMLSDWLALLDELLPSVQFVASLSRRNGASLPSRLRRRRLPVVAAPSRARPRARAPAPAPAGTALLIQVDGRLPNLALMKLGTHLRRRGKRVALARGDSRMDGYRTVFASCVFDSSASRRRVQSLEKKYGARIDIGGSGIDIRRRLPSAVERCPPDLSLYPELCGRAIGFLTRGCPYRCAYCVVPRKEGNVRQVTDLEDLLQGRTRLILLDDNLLAHPQACAFLESMVRRNIRVNFHQSLDIRLLNRESAALLRRIDCANASFSRRAYYFSLNDTRNLERVRKKYELMGFSRGENVEFICMYGFNTTLREDVERFRFLRSLPGAYVFTQRYSPFPGSPRPKLEGFFDEDADALIDELIQILFPQNMKSMEIYYRWLGRQYAERFGMLHKGLTDTIFRYNYRDRKGRYIASLAGLRHGY
jgi:hypothetical protein